MSLYQVLGILRRFYLRAAGFCETVDCVPYLFQAKKWQTLWEVGHTPLIASVPVGTPEPLTAGVEFMVKVPGLFGS